MSGVFALWALGGARVDPADLDAMAAMLARRGPEGSAVWHGGTVGLGHTLLATTPEALTERQPVEHEGSGCVITADVRLDNRDELMRTLDLVGAGRSVGDAELILRSYLRWGERCVERLLGDFAFIIWDPRQQRLICGRDRLGMRPCVICLVPGKFVALASEPRAVLVLDQVPYAIDERRVADFLLEDELEGSSLTRTFFRGVERIPAAHVLVVSEHGLRRRRYWRPEPGDELRLATDAAYDEAFLAVLGEAVRCRLRSVGPPASMLSGGLDSGSVTALASDIVAEEGRAPLATISAVSPAGRADVETRLIGDACAMAGIAPITVSAGELDELLPDLERLMWHADEPFDSSVLLRAVYVTAQQHGHKVVLDGAGGDSVLAASGYLPELAARGHLLRLARELRGQAQFWSGAYPSLDDLVGVANAVYVPDAILRYRRSRRISESVVRRIAERGIDPTFAAHAGMVDRLKHRYPQRARAERTDARLARAAVVADPNLVVARERYNRLASAVGVEARDPFLDDRVVSFCLSLPGRQVMRDGWPKAIIRRALDGRLPATVRWRRGRDHLGWDFTEAFMHLSRDRIGEALSDRQGSGLGGYGSLQRQVWFGTTGSAGLLGLPACEMEWYFSQALLAAWLDVNARRPVRP